MLIGWIRACHPGPTAVVTAIATALAASIGWTGWGLAGIVFAVLLGQISVGWSNDALDAPTDAAAGRLDKPTVSDGVPRTPLLIAAIAVACAACALSWVVAGPIGGTCHVIGIAVAWLYNLRLSRTGWAWVSYAVAFGLLPSFVIFGYDRAWPPAWLTIAFVVIGVSAHLANSLRDIDVDTAIAMGGSAPRLGRRRTRLLAWVLLAIGAVIVTIAVFPVSPIAAIAGLAAVAILMAVSRRLGDGRAFATILAAAGVLAIVGILGL